MPYELFISARYLKAKRKQAFISLISVISVGGVAIGVWALIVVLAVMTGFKDEIRDKILGIMPHVLIQKAGAAITPQEFQDLSTRFRTLPSVTEIAPFVSGQVLISYGDNVSGVMLHGIDLSHQAAVARQEKNLRDGSFALLNAQYDPVAATSGPKRDGIILGLELSRLLGVFSGDEITVIAPNGYLLPTGLAPKMKKFRVVGIFSSGFYEYDSGLAYISLTAAQKFFRMGATLSGVNVWLHDVYQSQAVVSAIKTGLAPGFQAQDWAEMNKSLFSAINLEKLAMFLITGLIGLVAAFNIISTLVMMVMEKHADIATLKSLGATSQSIMKIFMLEGSIIGLLGTLIGSVLGVGFCWLADTYKLIPLQGGAYFFDHIPFTMTIFDVVLVIGVALLICFLSTLYPARHASKLDPVTVFRYE